MITTLSLRNSKRQIDGLFDLIDPVDDSYFELYSHWAQYMIIRVAGFMEEAYETIFSRYIKSGSSPTVSRYAGIQITRSKANPNHDKIFQTLNSFSHQWALDYESYANENGRKEALNSLMKLRHKVAHGENIDTSIQRVKDYYEKCIELVCYVEMVVGL